MNTYRIAVALALSTFALAAQAQDAKEILSETGVQGGLVVHVGCGDGTLTAALRQNDSYLVHGLDADAGNVAAAREHIRSLGLYGPVSVDQLTGSALPYADNLVNLVILSGGSRVTSDEIMRVLAPGGVVLDTRHAPPVTRRKARPGNIDEWTHHLHDAGGNPVARDSVVGPPQHLQWTAGPLWARSHGWTPSVSAMVSANGRVFYILDETLTGVDATVPSKWYLVARDAFSGVLLWKQPVGPWGSAAMSGTPDTGAGVSVGRFTMPNNVGKRLVAVGDTVYATLGADAPVTALDAATGEVKRVFADTAHADEILVSDGRLIVAINPPPEARPAVTEKDQSPAPPPGKHVCAVDPESGNVRWRKGPFTGVRSSRGQDPFGRLELSAGDGKVFLLTTDAVECLAAESGDTAWRIDRPALAEGAVRKLGYAGIYEYLLTVMVYHDGVVLLAQPEPNTHHTYHTMPGTLYAFDAKDGRQRWKHAYGGWGHCTPPDVFVIDDTVWTHVHVETEYGSVWGNGYKAKDSSKVDYRIQALDLRTGALRRELPTKDIFDVGHHHRCYRNKITDRFLLSSRRGVEFVDLESGENWQNHWVRSGCLLGNLPCNGLVYVTPHPCGCYRTALLTGFNALAAGSESERASASGRPGQRLERGPAYTGKRQSTIANQQSDDWPTYRHDGFRSGATLAGVLSDRSNRSALSETWKAALGGKLSAVTVAEGKLFVAQVDQHTVHALDAATGEPVWRFTAGGRIDSPPTSYDGKALFGSADGHVYCLRASDGTLVWRFAAAPQRRLVSSHGQLESAWPVHGSVLVQDGKCWFAAGRSSYLDGGIHVYALDPATGAVLHRDTVYHADAATGKQPVSTSPNQIPGLLSDLPGSDGENVFIRQMNVSTPGSSGKQHLFTTGGFLDSSWFNRTFWKCGRAQTSGVMVLGDEVAYGVELYDSRSRETVFKPGAHKYRIVCAPLKAPPRPANAKGRPREPKRLWEQHVGIRITALVRAGDRLFAAGSPDLVDPADPHAAWEGRKGGVLAVFATEDGRKLAEYKLPSPPVWDGMALARGLLYVSLRDGTVVCWRAGGEGPPGG